VLDYVSTEAKDCKKLEKISILWKKKDVVLEFKKEGCLTESFIIILLYKEYFNEKIDSIFLIANENNIIKKEKIWNHKKLTESYKKYISIITDRSERIGIGSDNYEKKDIKGIEIRMKKNTEFVWPTEKGYEEKLKEINEN